MNGMNNELFRLRQVKTPITLVQERIQTLKQRLKNPSRGISNIHGWLNDPDLDSLMKANAIKNYRSAWNLYRKVHHSGTPVFHKKRVEQTYQTSCVYSNKVSLPNMKNGSVRIIDLRHVHYQNWDIYVSKEWLKSYSNEETIFVLEQLQFQWIRLVDIMFPCN
jgi:hypothetical protein